MYAGFKFSFGCSILTGVYRAGSRSLLLLPKSHIELELNDPLVRAARSGKGL